MRRILSTTAVLGVAILIVGCGKGGNEEPAVTTQVTQAPPLLAAVFSDVPVGANTVPIPELRQTAKPGDEVVLEAKVMGTGEPFVENRALFVVGDEETLTSCDILHGDGCATPWDVCCEDPKEIRVGTATIQVVDDSGSILRHSIKGVSGLKELSRLRIAGVVAPNSTEVALIINASKIQVL